MPEQGIQFSVVLTEGRPDETGLTMARALDDMHVPVIAILDSAVAYALEAFRRKTYSGCRHPSVHFQRLQWAMDAPCLMCTWSFCRGMTELPCHCPSGFSQCTFDEAALAM